MKPARGFIALISVIVMSTVLLGAAATLSQDVFFTRFDSLNLEYRKIARSLADACTAKALLLLADDYDYLVQRDRSYDPDAKEVPVALGTLYGDPIECAILGPTTTPQEVDRERVFLVTTKASFKSAFVTLVSHATVHNPDHGTGRALPTVSPDSPREVP